MLLEYELLVMNEPWQVILHDKEERIYFGTGPASDA
jgi:hypothetical protein